MEADAHLKTPETPPAEAPVPGYHRRSAHRFEAYAAGPGSLDWDAQPAAFRHYPGCPVVLLPLVDTCLAQAPGGALRGALVRPFVQLGEAAAIAPGLDSLGALLQLALGLTAWKRLGPDRWAVRANPSSGNLHPVEAWVITHGWPGLGDGVHHYRPDDHALELRAADAPAGTTAEPRLFIALSSVMWREAWKYGERAFRYCQLDVGHALGALRYAAAVLGWDLVEQRHIGHATLAARLGLDRFEDYPTRRDPATEREEPELLLAVGIGGEPAPASATALRDACAAASWFGSASTIDRHPMYRWPIVSEVAELTRRGDATIAMTPAQAPRTGRVEDDGEGVSAAALILHRRSAQRFDAAHVMPLEGLCALLDALDVDARVPLDVLAEQRCIDLLLFIHRVEGMAAGLYLFRRDPRAALPPALAQAFPERCAEPVERRSRETVILLHVQQGHPEHGAVGRDQGQIHTENRVQQRARCTHDRLGELDDRGNHEDEGDGAQILQTERHQQQGVQQVAQNRRQRQHERGRQAHPQCGLDLARDAHERAQAEEFDQHEVVHQHRAD